MGSFDTDSDFTSASRYSEPASFYLGNQAPSVRSHESWQDPLVEELHRCLAA